jgi:hypothetical protein
LWRSSTPWREGVTEELETLAMTTADFEIKLRLLALLHLLLWCAHEEHDHSAREDLRVFLRQLLDRPLCDTWG